MPQITAPVQAAVTAIDVAPGQAVCRGQVLLRLESMKMELPVEATVDGTVQALHVAVGDAVQEGQALLAVAPQATVQGSTSSEPARGPGAGDDRHATARDLLAHRRALLTDAARPDDVARRHADGRRTARENVAALLDAGSVVEYGAFAVAAQRNRRPVEELQRRTPADGLVTATGHVDGRPAAVMAYDYTVLAGTQGVFNHRKSDRLLALAARERLPLVLFAEGGGGRPGDVDWLGVAGLDCTTFGRLAALAETVPTVGIAAGWCFAGNAALLGCCELVIATEGSSIGLGGPAMIEGGGLGRVAPADVGPVDALAAAGAVDAVVADEGEAVVLARRYLALAAGDAEPGPAGADVATLHQALPAARQGAFDPRPIVTAVCDAGSVTELRPVFGRSLVTALARLHGRAVAIVANDSRHGGGALDADACDKLARFMRLAQARGWPLVALVDTPGFMVGPASERQGMLRRAGEVFRSAARLRVPVAAVVLRRGFGLGAMAMTAGHFHAPVATAAWPSAEFGGMGLEGAVRLGFRKELEAQPEGEARDALFAQLLADAQARGQALNMASHLEIDDVIDPVETRDWLRRVLATAPRSS